VVIVVVVLVVVVVVVVLVVVVVARRGRVMSCYWVMVGVIEIVHYLTIVGPLEWLHLDSWILIITIIHTHHYLPLLLPHHVIRPRQALRALTSSTSPSCWC